MAQHYCLYEFLASVTSMTPRPLTANDLAALWMVWFVGDSPEAALGLLEMHDDRELLVIARERLHGAVERSH